MKAPTTIGRLLADAPLVLPGVWDALSARLAARAGCRAVFVSGYALSATRLGAGDLGLVTQTEMLDAAARVCAAVEVPVIADADTGYGDERNVARTVRELVRAGAAGCFLEDQVWPKRCGHLEGKRVVSLDEYLAKLRAALRARGDAPFHVTARTDARAVHGLDEALVRARAFAGAGADAVFVEAPETEDEMARIRAAVPADVPLVANMVEGGRTPLRSASALARAGYRMIVRPLTALFAATRAVREAYEALGDDDRAADTPSFAFAEMNDVLGVGHLTRASRS